MIAALEGEGEDGGVLSMLGGGKRLLILCHLVKDGVSRRRHLRISSVLSQSALSGHLARLIEVSRRESQMLRYSVAGGKVGHLPEDLYEIHCADEAAPG